jgi:threonylcarbamoyladenosine tRNA methylthiotransferase CDKAL1
VRVYVESFGCAQNQGEGHAIERELALAGHELLDGPEAADAAVLVTCGVIGPTEARMVRRWRSVARRVPRTVVTGCLVPLRTHLFTGEESGRTTFVPIREQQRIPELLGESPLTSVELDRDQPAPRRVAEEVVLAQGCTSGCSYCFSRLARGTLSSVPPGTVVARVREAAARGVREVRLTGLDTAAWGVDLAGRPTLAELVAELSEGPDDVRIRVGMMSPQTLGRILEPYAAALGSPKVFRFLHLPVQSGSDEILGRMHRGYTVSEFRRQVAAVRHSVPDVHLATDVIVGFPGETEDDHRATEALVEELGPETVNVTRFSARPGTPAARLPPLPPRTAKRRSRSLAALRQRVARDRLERWIGTEDSARVLEYGPGHSAVARLPNYLPVVLDRRPALGTDVEVRIVGARSTYLEGQMVGAGF